MSENKNNNNNKNNKITKTITIIAKEITTTIVNKSIFLYNTKNE